MTTAKMLPIATPVRDPLLDTRGVLDGVALTVPLLAVVVDGTVETTGT